MVVSNNTFAKTICSICYEDLKPIVEDLQSISICGHVFHELCIQQWFEYCAKGKKKNCPVCKQTCSESGVSRLYFQSVGDPNESIGSKKQGGHEESPEELREEVRRLERKVQGLTSVMESQQNDLRAINDELWRCKAQLKKEEELKHDAFEKTQAANRLLHLKSEELDKSTLQCARLQDRNMALAKELAAFKLVSDVNLEEEEILKLASLGSEANGKETVEVLKKSLVIRNKSYKELMTKCNTLGRGEARSNKKLEKAKEKIMKLKTRVLELETAMETKDNETLRTLRTSKKTSFDVDGLTRKNLDPGLSKLCRAEDKNKEPVLSRPPFDPVESMSEDLFGFRETKRFRNSEVTGKVNNSDNITAAVQVTHSYFLIDDDEPQVSPLNDFSSLARANKDKTTNACHFKSPGMESHTWNKPNQHESGKSDGDSRSRSACKDHTMGNHTTCADDDDVVLIDDSTKEKPSLTITKETSLPNLVSPGEICFSGGLKGPDGTNWHLGKWCKRGQSKGLAASSVSKQGLGDLIAEGADGRGGRIKVLRSLNSSSLDAKETPAWTKNCKNGARTNTLQSRGCLQIDHFFARSVQK